MIVRSNVKPKDRYWFHLATQDPPGSEFLGALVGCLRGSSDHDGGSVGVGISWTSRQGCMPNWGERKVYESKWCESFQGMDRNGIVMFSTTFFVWLTAPTWLCLGFKNNNDDQTAFSLLFKLYGFRAFSVEERDSVVYTGRNLAKFIKDPPTKFEPIPRRCHDKHCVILCHR